MAEPHTLHVDPSNAEQLRAWDGDEGAYWAEHAVRFDRAVAPHHARLMDAAAIESADRVLDVGCGTGQTTRDAARAATRGSALGVDLSSEMLAVARRLAADEGVSNAVFVQGDAQVHPFDPASFDVVISRTGAMFFGDLPAAFSNLAAALRPGGRIVLLTWQPLADNEWIREFSTALAGGRERPVPPPDAPGPFSLSDPDRVRQVLTGAGFVDVTFEDVRAPMHFGTDVDDAYRFVLGVSGWMADGLDADARRQAFEALRASIAAHATPEGVQYESAAWIVTAIRP